MTKFYDPNREELTSTLNITSLRPVPSDAEPTSKLSSDELRIVKALSPETAMFIIIAGPGKGSRFLIDTDLVSIGRDPQSDIFLDDITVSRKHAQLKKKSEYLVEDLNSLNGTYINSKSVSKASLSNGDELQIGKYRLTFFVANEK